jgi:hypothetical protein
VRPDDAENPSRATPAGGTPKGDKSGDAAGGEED